MVFVLEFKCDVELDRRPENQQEQNENRQEIKNCYMEHKNTKTTRRKNLVIIWDSP